MRVLQLVKTSVGAGWALRQVSELVKRGMDVHVALPDGGPMVDKYRSANVTVHLLQTDCPIKKPWKWPSLNRAFRRLVDDVSPDIIHSHFVGTTLTMRMALGKSHPTPRVFQVPGPLHLEHPIFSRGEIWSASSPDQWIASCEWTRQEYYRRGIEKDRVHLSYYGMDIDTFATSASGKLRDELGVDSNRQLVGMVAYMYAPKRYLGQTRGLKGHEDFIDAMAICCKVRSDLLAVIVGGAWNNAQRHEDHVRAYAQKKLGDQVRFLGVRNDVNELYGDFDVAVHPSHSENVGGACESLLLAVPTIATRVGGFPDLVIPKETGWLVPPKAPASLAHAILDALEKPDLAKQMAIRGQERTRSLFDVRTTSANIHAIYQEILSR